VALAATYNLVSFSALVATYILVSFSALVATYNLVSLSTLTVTYNLVSITGYGADRHSLHGSDSVALISQNREYFPH